MPPPADEAPARATRPSLLRALDHRNYRLFFAGQTVSLIGTWLTRVATSWLVYRLTHSALLLGLVGFAGQIPTFLLSPLAGVMVDRWNRHRILVVTQVLAMLQSCGLAVLSLTGAITVPHVIALNLLQGVINAFDTPARQAFVIEMVERREDLPNAIALNSSMVNGARLIGPSVAGVLIATVGEGGCFTIDAASYLAVIASLLAMRLQPRPHVARRSHVLTELREGVRYSFGFAPIRAILLLLSIVSLMGMPYTVLMPILATEVLRGGPHTLGFLMAAVGVGALGGAYFLGTRESVLGLGRVVVLSAAMFGGGLVAFSFSRWLALSLPLMVVTGFGMMVAMASCNTILQTVVEEQMRGRVMSFYTMSVLGTAPFGSLMAGAVAARIGAPWTVAIGGGVCVVAALLFATKLSELRAMVRPIYVRLGIIPEIAEGMQSATQRMAPSED